MANDTSIFLRILSSQTDMEGNVENMEIYTEGKLSIKEHCSYISYKETEISGMEGSTTTLRIAQDEITLIRFGSINTKLYFKKGTTTKNKYDTQYGIFDIEISTSSLEVVLSEAGASSIKLEYTMSFGDGASYFNKLTLNY